MKKNLLSIASLVFIGAATMTSCTPPEGCTDNSPLIANFDSEAEEDDGSCILRYELGTNDSLVSSNITTNTTWTSDKVWILPSRIAVENGAILTIEAGTVIKGVPGTQQNASALVIAQGGKIMANGTSDDPIIFTSTDDNITSGTIVSPNLQASTNSKWGGLIVLGKAPISADAAVAQIEGIPASDVNGRYGGSVANDNSGVLNYVSVRHGGTNIGEGNEINGITFGGVGSGTTVTNIEVVGNQDDGVEFFGGSVNATNVIVWGVGDDMIDTDQAYSGTIDNIALVCGDDTDHAFELDGAEGSTVATTVIKNATVMGNAKAEMGQLRDSAMVEMSNMFFFNFDTADGRGDLSFQASASEFNFTQGVTTFENLEVGPMANLSTADDLKKVLKGGIDAHGTWVAAGAQTTGADLSVFSGWSWTIIELNANLPSSSGVLVSL